MHIYFLSLQFLWTFGLIEYIIIKFNHKNHLSLLASLSHSNRDNTSPTLTEPLTFLISWRFSEPSNSTLTYVIPPLDPVLPKT